MPSIDVAMARSVKGGALNLLVAAIRPAVDRRDAISNVQGQITDVKTAFSSWDNCMRANFCKYPVIAIIVIGGLIILSVVWCIARCMCCGLSCCCECFQCLKCCGNCCGCCDPPGGRRNKHLDEPYLPPNQGYRSQAPMSTGVGGGGGGGFKSAAHDPPQYAEFDVSKKGGEDSLPEMPSWEGAANSKKVLDDDSMELETLKKPETPGQNMPLMAGATSGHISPVSPGTHSPYGYPDGHHGSSPYMAGGAGASDPYARGGQDYYNDPRGYGQSASSLGVDQGYGIAGGAMGPGRRSPRAYNNGGGYGQPNQGYPAPSLRSRQGSYDDYNRSGPLPQGMPGYGMDRREPRVPDMVGGGGGYRDQPRRSPAPQGDHNRGGGGYQNGPYGPPQRQYSSDSTRPLARPPLNRQYSHGPAPPSPSNLQNNSGFDFNSGYSRPPTQGRDETADYDHGLQQSSTSPTAAYPGYKPYQPADNNRRQEGWSGL